MGDYKYIRDELPTHDVHITSFWIDVTEVTYEYWFEIADWAEENGYEFSDRPSRAKKGATWSPVREQHPMNMVRWYDAIKWCNARSEHDGRFLHGIVDEVRIYNRILNEKEALQNFKATNNSMVVEASDKLAVIWACTKSAR